MLPGAAGVMEVSFNDRKDEFDRMPGPKGTVTGACTRKDVDAEKADTRQGRPRRASSRACCRERSNYGRRPTLTVMSVLYSGAAAYAPWLANASTSSANAAAGRNAICTCTAAC